jgi:hypothetical protein
VVVALCSDDVIEAGWIRSAERQPVFLISCGNVDDTINRYAMPRQAIGLRGRCYASKR